MFSFAQWLDLPLIWGGLIGVAILVYIVLDGFDLGVGILFPFAINSNYRNKMMNSIAPFWDGNETWLVLGGGGLFAVFPLAYAIIMPALYIPIIAMLLCLVLRGVAFEFRYKATKETRPIWDASFHIGSVGAAFCQGVLLGAIIQGIEVTGRSFSGGPFDWLSAFSMITGVALVFGYALLGATWLIMKTEGKTLFWARRVALYLLPIISFFMLVVSIWVLTIDTRIAELWLGKLPNALLLIPLIALICLAMCVRSLVKGHEYIPFFSAIGLFVMGFLGLVISVFPWIVPYQVTLADAAAIDESLSLLLIGAVILLPIILMYTAYTYYVFRGKVDARKTMY